MDNPEIGPLIGVDCFSMTPGSLPFIFLTGTSQRAGLVPVKKPKRKVPGVMEEKSSQKSHLQYFQTYGIVGLELTMSRSINAEVPMLVV